VRQNANENGQISPSNTIRAARGAGNRRHRAPVLRKGRKSANIRAYWGFILQGNHRTPQTGKFDYFITPNQSARSMALEFFTTDKVLKKNINQNHLPRVWKLLYKSSVRDAPSGACAEPA
jgi:hypothetical protein